MSFGEAVRSVLNKYAVFSGRSRRSEYWFWTLATVIVYVVIQLIGLASNALGIALLVVFFLAVLIPGLAVSVRRLHDTNRTGWWLLIGLVPLVGGIVLIVFMATDGTPGHNNYGPSPKHEAVGYS